MCSSKCNVPKGRTRTSTVVHINGRPVLQPASNYQDPTFQRRNSLEKKKKPLPSPPNSPKNKSQKPPSSPPVSPKLKSPRQLIDRPKEAREPKAGPAAPGSIAAARREEVATLQQQRKVKIAHYGRRTSSTKLQHSVSTAALEEKRCTFITPNSDPVYVEYHDEEWGVPVHDDKLLFELLVLTGAQIGSDWSRILKKREAFREAFSGFDPETVAGFSEKRMSSISSEYGIEAGLVRGAVENARRIEQVRSETGGSFARYLWGFVQNKAMVRGYRQWQRVPAKTSKSEGISKDMVRRGFRFVGPTVIHSFMQAAGLTNDHLLSCPRHHFILHLQA